MSGSNKHPDNVGMAAAIEAAKESRRLGDYAIGAATMKGGKILGVAGNRIRTETDPTSHTEIVAIRMACRDLGTRYLTGVTLYSTHAPCPQCLTACIWAKVDRVVYGASQKDIQAYGAKHGTDHYKWRGVDIEPEELYSKYLRPAHPGMRIKQHMRRECNELFHTCAHVDTCGRMCTWTPKNARDARKPKRSKSSTRTRA